jgi:hypothetical protein
MEAWDVVLSESETNLSDQHKLALVSTSWQFCKFLVWLERLEELSCTSEEAFV